MRVDNHKEMLYALIPHLPQKLQEKVTNQMDVDERSKYDEYMTEDKSANIPMHGLSFRHRSVTNVRVEVIHTITQRKANGYFYQFVEVSRNNKHFTQVDMQTRKEISKCELDPSMDIIQQAKMFFTNLLVAYQSQIKSFSCTGSPVILFDNLKGQLKNLTSLEEIDADETIYLENLLPVVLNTTKPLKDVCIIGREINNVLKNFDQIFEVRNNLILEHLQLDLSKFLRLKAKCVRIHIGSLTEVNVFTIFAQWKMGRLRSGVKSYEWLLNDSNFEVMKLSRLFGEESMYALEREKKVVIKHDNRPLVGSIWWSEAENCLHFHVSREEGF